MKELTWSWTLPSGEIVKATLDRGRGLNDSRGTESVWLGRRLVSRTPLQRAGGHVVGSSSTRNDGPYRSTSAQGVAVVAFGKAGDADICTLTLDDEVIAPNRAPGSALEGLRSFASRHGVACIGIALVAVVATALAALPKNDEVTASKILVHEAHEEWLGEEAAKPETAQATPPTTNPAPVVHFVFVEGRRSPSPPHSTVVVRRAQPVSVPKVPKAPKVDVVCDEQGACQGLRVASATKPRKSSSWGLRNGVFSP